MNVPLRNTLRVVAILAAAAGVLVIRVPRAFGFRLSSSAGFFIFIGGTVLMLYALMASAVLGSCPHCGTPLPPDTNPCPHCGKSLNN